MDIREILALVVLVGSVGVLVYLALDAREIIAQESAAGVKSGSLFLPLEFWLCQMSEERARMWLGERESRGQTKP